MPLFERLRQTDWNLVANWKSSNIRPHIISKGTLCPPGGTAGSPIRRDHYGPHRVITRLSQLADAMGIHARNSRSEPAHRFGGPIAGRLILVCIRDSVIPT